MEVKEKSKKRELIKTIAIVFLTVLLALTFFSNTIMNRSLPEVATQAVSSGTINAKIRGNGTISANESYEVIINQTREVRSVCVKVGDTVEQGDLLFVLGDVESQELKDAQEQLQTLNLNYQKQLLNLTKEYATEDRSIQILQEDLQKAIEQRDANLVTDTDISYAKGDLAAAKNELTQIGLILEELNALMADNEEYQNAKTAVDEWTTKVETYKKDLDAAEAALAAVTGGSSTDTAYLQSLCNQAAQAKAAAEKTYEEKGGDTKYAQLAQEAKNYMIASNLDITDAAKLLYYMNYIAEQDDKKGSTGTDLKQGYSDLLAAYNQYQTAIADLERAEKNLATATGNTASVAELTQQRNTAQQNYSNAQYQLQQANYTLSQAEGSNGALKNQIKDYEAAKRQQDAVIETLNQTITELEAKKTVYDAAVTTIAEKERALEDALSGKDIDKQLDDLDLQATRLDIQKQQELVDKYKKEAVDTEIKANVSGVVSAINVSAGKDTTAGSPMAVIDVVDRGYTIKIPVTNDQAKQVKVGDTADITNYYWGNDLTATLEAITADPQKPGQGKLLIFRITGEIDAGTNISLSIGQKSANYDTIIPKSALREDSNGSFVLVVVAKNTPLGNRYIATRADVQVLAQDDTSAAVSGLSAGDYVITTSSKPLEAGTQVRMVENP